MADVVDRRVRSRMMAGIQSKNTRPELQIRSLLHRYGFRFRVHVDTLSGKPDLVLPKYRAAIFVNGCFWHRHNCYLFKWPSTRHEFWRAKIEGNRGRDLANIQALRKAGWRVLTIWECSLKGKLKLEDAELLASISEWLMGSNPEDEIAGK